MQKNNATFHFCLYGLQSFKATFSDENKYYISQMNERCEEI